MAEPQGAERERSSPTDAPREGGLRVAPRLEVGRVDDPAELEADAMAAQVMAVLQHGATDLAPVTTGAGRVRRRAASDPLGGMAVDADVEKRIRRAGPGRPLPDTTRAAMEGAFGADLSHVRTHIDSVEALDLRAEAFTLGSDIHFAPGRFDTGSSAGQELLAHELTHVVQQTGGRALGGAARRRIQRRLWTKDTFDTDTSEGFFTARSTAQVEVRKIIDEYHAAFPDDVPADKIPRALSLIAQMREMTNAWKTSHTTSDGAEDSNREKRMDGMKRFLENLASEEAGLRARHASAKAAASSSGGAAADPAATTAALDVAVNEATTGDDRARTRKVTDHYEGSGQSSFRHLGTVIDLAAPSPGDEAKVELGLGIPVEPTLTIRVTFAFRAEVERSADGVKMRTEIGAGVEGNVANVVAIGAELGGYYQVEAKTGADAAQLISYELYRRFKESKVIPSGWSAYLWGGRSSESGADKAEQWSKELETRLFGLAADAPTLSKHNGDWTAFAAARDAWLAAKGDDLDDLLGVYVESGAYTSVHAKANLGPLVEFEGVATGQLGRRIDFLSLTNRKGGAGEKNKKSDSVFNLSGGAQKNVGRTVGGFVVEVKASAGPLEGAGKYVARWLSDGKRASEGETAETSFEWELEVEGTGKAPFGELIGGGAGGWIAGMAGVIAQTVRRAAAEEEATDAQKGGSAARVGEDAALAVTQMAKVPTKDWTPAIEPAAEADGGTQFEGDIAVRLKISGEPDGLEVTLSLVKSSGIDVAGFFKASVEKSQRLIGLKVTKDGYAAI